MPADGARRCYEASSPAAHGPLWRRNCQSCRIISCPGTRLPGPPRDYCRAVRIAVCNTRGYAVNSLPEHALMLMLALRRNLISYREDIRRKRWHEAAQFCLLDHPISDLKIAIRLAWTAWHLLCNGVPTCKVTLAAARCEGRASAPSSRADRSFWPRHR